MGYCNYDCFIISMPASIPDISRNYAMELPEKGVLGARRGLKTFEMDERRPMANSTAEDTIVINIICNMDISVFDEGSTKLETSSSSLK